MNNPTFKKDQLKESSMKTNNKGAQMNQTYFDELICKRLAEKYGKSVLNKTELSHELGISVSTINNYISKGFGLPNFVKIGRSANGSVIFPIEEIAMFLTNTVKVA